MSALLKFEAASTIKFAETLLERQNLPCKDYRGFSELTIILLEEIPPRGMK